MRRLRFSHEIGGDWAEHVEPTLANVCMPTMQQQRAALHRKLHNRGLASVKRIIGRIDRSKTIDSELGLTLRRFPDAKWISSLRY